MLRRIILLSLLGLFTIAASVFVWLSYPSDFKTADVFLEPGTLPVEIATELEEAHVIRSALTLRIILKLRGTASELVPGEYLFEEPETVFKVASRITRGQFGTEQRKVTIPEGSTNTQIAALIKEAFPDFNEEAFLRETYGEQGYLFPETYYFLSTSTDKVAEKLRDMFDFQVRTLQSEAIMDGKNWDDVVVMASILEEESDTPEDHRIISGILWKRLSIGMPLQVDVARITYEQKGFPPQPLSNPGLETLTAALYPVETSYLYYLTGKDGKMYYAETYDQHRANIEKYLR